LLGGPKRREDRLGVPRPRGGSGDELSSAGGRQRVVLGSSVGVRQPPFAGDPFLLFEPMEGMVERAFLDLERSAGDILDPSSDGVPVSWPPGERLEDEHVEGAFEEVEGVVAHDSLDTRIALKVSGE